MKPQTDNLILPAGWMTDGVEDVSFNTITFNSQSQAIELRDSSEQIIRSLPFSSITEIKLSQIYILPVFSVTLANKKYQIGFMETASGLKKVLSKWMYLKFAVSKYGADSWVPNLSASAYEYQQMFKSIINDLHDWLRSHNIKSYRASVSPNAMAAIVFICLFPAVIIIGVIVASIFSALFNSH